jgi:hypothetical protein
MAGIDFGCRSIDLRQALRRKQVLKPWIGRVYALCQDVGDIVVDRFKSGSSGAALGNFVKLFIQSDLAHFSPPEGATPLSYGERSALSLGNSGGDSSAVLSVDWPASPSSQAVLTSFENRPDAAQFSQFAAK